MMRKVLEAEPLNLGGIASSAAFQGFHYRVGDFVLRAGIDETADAPIGQGIDAAIAVAAYYRQACSRRLEEDDAEALACARHGKGVRGGETAGQITVCDLAGEHDALGNAGAPGQPAEAHLVVIATASESPAEREKEYAEVFHRLGADSTSQPQREGVRVG